MFKWAVPVISTAMLFLHLPLAIPQASSDWTKRYGSPAAERYVIRDGIVVTVFYSEEGRTCKADIRPVKPQPPSGFEEVLNEIVPVGARGFKVSSFIIKTGGLNAIAYTDYQRVRISVASTGDGTASGATTGNIVSATIEWLGIQCKLQEQKHRE
jgi:hypothetical protein